MKFDADIIFEDTEYLFCSELTEGYQYFKNWEEFIDLYSKYFVGNVKPLYVFKATREDKTIFVDISQLVIIPWDELENYI